ncbi:hypothetical protein [Streptomyces mirabilis]|uniref:hypothetical protein n=1 Tax=Streptomyces mirabilis TaxID=68239 RepID=UPI00340B63B9
MKDRTGRSGSALVERVPTMDQIPDRASTSTSRPGRLRVDYLDAYGPNHKSLDVVADGTKVTATGFVTTLAVNGPDDAPRATALVTGMNGESACCLIGTEHYLAVSGYLAEGQQVQVRGAVRRPLKDMPAVIDATEIREVRSGSRSEHEATADSAPHAPTVSGTGRLSLVTGTTAPAVVLDVDEVRDAFGDALASWYVAGLRAGSHFTPVMKITLEPLGAPGAPLRSFQVSVEQVADLLGKVRGSDTGSAAALRAVEGEQ